MIPRDQWAHIGGASGIRIARHSRAVDPDLHIVATWNRDDTRSVVDLAQHFGSRAIIVTIDFGLHDESAAAAYEAACIIIDDPATARDAAVQWIVEVHPQHPTPDTITDTEAP